MMILEQQKKMKKNSIKIKKNIRWNLKKEKKISTQ
jgi:hypothetical protein